MMKGHSENQTEFVDQDDVEKTIEAAPLAPDFWAEINTNEAVNQNQWKSET